jgi:hypothetical protein
MRDAAWAKSIVAWIQGNGAIPYHHAHFAFDHIERLVFVMVKVPWRLEANGNDLLDHAECAVGLKPTCANPRRDAEERERCRQSERR